VEVLNSNIDIWIWRREKQEGNKEELLHGFFSNVARKCKSTEL